jgi:hypothetical protein
MLQAEGEEFAQKLQRAGVLVAFFSAGADVWLYYAEWLAVSDTTSAVIELAGLRLKRALA